MRWWSRRTREQELERELRSHLELAAAEQEENGLSPEEAAWAARRAFGNSTRIMEDARELWGWNLAGILLQDMRRASRNLRKSPGFAATAILTLALGIGASTAVFTLLDSVVLKPLAYRNSGALVAIWEHMRFLSFDPVGPNPRHADLWSKETTSFSGMALLQEGLAGLALGSEHPRLVGTLTSSANVLDVLQVTPALGRGFLPEDDVKGHDNVAILAWPLWKTVLHGDPNVVGRTIRVADVPRVVVGVLPESFRFPDANALRPFSRKQKSGIAIEPSIFLPAALDPNAFGWNGDFGNWFALARLKPGTDLKHAQAQLAVVERRIARQASVDPKDLYASVQPLREAVIGDSGTALWMLMAAVAGLMLIACLNLANAQLGRAVARQREASVSIALGAARWRLVWNALTENLLLAAIGGSAGIGFAALGLRLLRAHSPLDLPRLSEVHLNMTVLLFSVALTFGSSFLFGMLPALKLMRTDPQAALQQSSSRTFGTKRSGRLRACLVGLQVLGCTALLLTTGLFSNSLLYLLHRDKGFDTANVALAEVRLPNKTWSAASRRTAFADSVLQGLRESPGVQSAALVSTMPFEGESWIEGVARIDQPNLQSLINLRWVSAGYFETLRERLVAGRFPEERDRDFNNAVISESLAKALWQNENPIGSQIATEDRKFTVIGVVADSRATSMKAAPPRVVYLHYKDRPPYAMVFLSRSARPAGEVLADLRQTIWKYAPDLPIARVKTMNAQLNESLAAERFQTTVLMAFGIAALLLAMLGIYGVLSYSMVTRMREIGLRIALGATRRRIYALAAGELGIPVCAGLAGGLITGVLAARVIRNLLYGTRVFNSPVMLLVTGLFLSAAAMAAFLPARRAAALDPMETLRSE